VVPLGPMSARGTTSTGPFVDARERDAGFIGRPPVTGAAIHFLLRDEFRDRPKRQRVLALRRHGRFRAAAAGVKYRF